MKGISLLRREEYKRLAQLRIDGKILDVGGSKRSGYHELIKGTHTFEVGNIDMAYDADTEFDAEQPWPYADGSFDGVLFINLLEHLYEYRTAVEEARRVLKDDGVLAGVVPFLYNVHGSPNDYFRYTRSSLERLLAEAGFVSVTVEELGTGAFSVVHHILIGVMRPRWIVRALAPVCTAIDRVLSRLRPGNLMSAASMPLGYYFEARTQGGIVRPYA